LFVNIRTVTEINISSKNIEEKSNRKDLKSIHSLITFTLKYTISSKNIILQLSPLF